MLGAFWMRTGFPGTTESRGRIWGRRGPKINCKSSHGSTRIKTDQNLEKNDFRIRIALIRENPRKSVAAFAVALCPAPSDAFGVGAVPRSTAKAATDQRGLRRIKILRKMIFG